MTERNAPTRRAAPALAAALLLSLLATASVAQQPPPPAPSGQAQPPRLTRQPQNTGAPTTQSAQPETPATAPAARVLTEANAEIDIVGYRIDAEMTPSTNTLTATTVTTVKFLKPARSAVLELNGSLRVSAIRGPDGKPLQFIQDTLDQYTVKVDLGQAVTAGQQMDLTFDYAGQLVSAEGGPLPDKRLAYVGPEGAYLHYASRWFPFHGYGADRATAEIRLTIPTAWKLAANSDTPATSAPGKTAGTTVYTITRTSPVLPGTLAAGPYIAVPVRTAGFTVEFFALPGSEGTAQRFAEEIAQIVDYYQRTFGPYPFGDRYVVAQTDDESLEMLAGSGIEFMASEVLRRNAETPVADLAREVAFQWWGQAVGLKSFDSIWVSAGLAQYSGMLYQQSQMTPSEFASLLAETSERALTYESEVSITQAPSQLNDQTPAFRSIVFHKGAYVFHMLRNTLGDDKFFGLLREWYGRNKGANVSIADFERAVSAAAGQDMRWYFGLWVESTGVPEFTWDYTVLRSKEGDYRVRGTLKQSIEGFRMPVEVVVTSAGGAEERVTLDFNGTTADFSATTKGGRPSLVIDPDRDILRVSESIRTAVVVRRGIQEMQRESYMEAEERFREALKLSPRSSWAWYNLGLLYMRQRNMQKAIDAFTQAIAGDLDPTWIEVWSIIYRGNAYDALGQRERAVAEYNKARENGTDYDGSQAAVERYLGQPYRPPAQ
jgi:aminopeptidase N